MMKTKQTLFLLLLCVVVIFSSCKDDAKNAADPTPDPTSDSTLIAVSGVMLRSVDTLMLGDSVQLTAIVLPENADDKSIMWGSNNNSVATVSGNGWVAALKVGSATITVITVNGGKAASCALTVLALPVDSTATPVDSIFIHPLRISLEAGKTDTLHVSIYPADAQNKTVTWSSSDSMTVAVSSKGVITAALSARPTTVTITATVDGKSASCLVGVMTAMTASASSEALISGNEGGASFLIDGNMVVKIDDVIR